MKYRLEITTKFLDSPFSFDLEAETKEETQIITGDGFGWEGSLIECIGSINNIANLSGVKLSIVSINLKMSDNE